MWKTFHTSPINLKDSFRGKWNWQTKWTFKTSLDRRVKLPSLPPFHIYILQTIHCVKSIIIGVIMSAKMRPNFSVINVLQYDETNKSIPPVKNERTEIIFREIDIVQKTLFYMEWNSAIQKPRDIYIILLYHKLCLSKFSTNTTM